MRVIIKEAFARLEEHKKFGNEANASCDMCFLSYSNVIMIINIYKIYRILVKKEKKRKEKKKKRYLVKLLDQNWHPIKVGGK